ncbi:hypothetical protein B0H13DRAFT_2265905 [Mycena leptocephala]|nr:hypothetical protein B0H13DRAFT_2265905 [Mycena leptocephala]
MSSPTPFLYEFMQRYSGSSLGFHQGVTLETSAVRPAVAPPIGDDSFLSLHSSYVHYSQQSNRTRTPPPHQPNSGKAWGCHRHIIDEILSEEIVNETDQYSDNMSTQRAKRITTAAVMQRIVERRRGTSFSTGECTPSVGVHSRVVVNARRSSRMGAQSRCGILASAMEAAAGMGPPRHMNPARDASVSGFNVGKGIERRTNTDHLLNPTRTSLRESERWARLQREIVRLQLTQSIRMGKETLISLKQACPAPPTEQEGYHCTILKSRSAHGNGEQMPGSGVWASLPRSHAFLTGGTEGPPLKRAPFDRRDSLWGRSRDPRVGHVPPASHSDASAAEWHTTTQIKKMVIFDVPDQPFNVRSKESASFDRTYSHDVIIVQRALGDWDLRQTSVGAKNNRKSTGVNCSCCAHDGRGKAAKQCKLECLSAVFKSSNFLLATI